MKKMVSYETYQGKDTKNINLPNKNMLKFCKYFESIIFG